MSAIRRAVISEICATSSSAATRGSEVLAEGGGRREDVAVAGGVGDDQGGEVLGGLVGVVGGVGHFDLG